MSGIGKKLNKIWEKINQFNLDAPSVAIAWQEVAGSVFNSEIQTGHRLLLFLSVWVVYCFDRLIDVRNIPRTEIPKTKRHQFHQRYAFSLRLVCQLAGAISIGLAFANLNTQAWLGALMIMGLTVLHLIISHNELLDDSFPLKKELRVGLIFGAGTILQPWSLRDVETPHFFYVWLVLGFLAAANCFWVSYWDNDISAQKKGGLKKLNLFSTGVSIVTSVLALAFNQGIIAFAAGLTAAFSNVGLLLLESKLGNKSKVWKQSMADILLLVIPCFFLMVSKFSGI